MKILKFKLNNYRSFYKETPWFFASTDDKKNVTVIHCENGVGKTTLLNALIWALYEVLTEDLQEPEQLANKRSLREAKIGEEIECYVELFFEHLMRKYRLKRTVTVKKLDSKEYVYGNTEVIMQFSGDNGRWTDIKDYSDEIGRILPKQLHNYFFFNGERIEWIQRPINKKEFIQAISLIVGDETYTRAIRHLNGAKKKLDEELANIGDAETKYLYKEKKELEEKLQEIEKRIGDNDKNLDGYRKQEKAFSELLISVGGEVSSLEEERQNLINSLKSIDNSLTDNRKILTNYLSDKGYLIFSPNAFTKFLDLIKDLRASGTIPQPYKSSFVKKILDEHICICGRPLIKGEKPYAEVETWLNRASMSEYEDLALKMEGVFEESVREIPNTFNEISRAQKARVELLKRKFKVEEKIYEIGNKLKGSDVERARELESELQKIRSIIEDTIFRQGEETKDANLTKIAINKKEREIEEREAKSAREKNIKLQIKACRLAVNETEKRRDSLKKENRKDLEMRINKIFNNISFKPYNVFMADDYSLSLESIDGTVGKSTSESQVLSLSFIGALMEQAKEYTAKTELIGLDSSIYPMVIDSAFGNLGEAYQKKVAEFTPTLSSQSIILVSKTQWNENIEKIMRPYVGKEYVISYFTPKNDATEINIQINGITYDLVKRSPVENDYMEINEVIIRG